MKLTSDLIHCRPKHLISSRDLSKVMTALTVFRSLDTAGEVHLTYIRDAPSLGALGSEVSNIQDTEADE